MMIIRAIVILNALVFACSLFAQNVGIAVDTPQTKLHVAGTLLADSLRIPSGARDNYWMRSDSMGNGYWAPLLATQSGASLVDAVSLVARPEYIAIQGDYMYVATENGDSLLVFDLNDPNAPAKVGGIQILFPHIVQGLIVSGNFAYPDYGNKIFVYDVTDPTNPVYRSFVPVISEAMAYANGYIYAVGNFENALFVINATNPDSLFHVDTIGIGGDPNGIVIEDGKAYIVDAVSDDLKVFDLTDPENPTLLGSKSFGFHPFFIDAHGDYVYVTDELKDSVYIFNVSDPTNPALAGQLGGFQGPSGIRTDGVFLHVSDFGLDSLFTFDITDPTQPKSLGATSVKFTPTQIDVRGNYIYLLKRSPYRIEVLRISQQNLITTGLTGEHQVFDGLLSGLFTIGSNNLMDHLRLNRIGAGGVHLTATDPPGLMVTSDSGDNLMEVDATTGYVGIGETGPNSMLVVRDDSGGENSGGPSLVQLYNGADKLNLDGDEIDATVGTLYLQNNVPHDLSLVMGGGSVGIGTDAPAALLEVSKSDSTYLRITSTNHQVAGIELVRSSEYNTDWRIANNGRLQFFSSLDLDNFITEEYSFDTDMFRPSSDMLKQLGDGAFRWNRGYFGEFIQVADSGVTHRLFSDASSGILGTVSNHTLKLLTNNATRILIDTTGNVGIGTTVPITSLQVANGTDASLTAHGYLVLGQETGGNLVIDNNEIMARNNNSAADLLLQHNGGNLIISANETGLMGIGTSSPEYPVHIEKDGTVGSPTIGLVIESATSRRPTILFSENSSNIDLDDGMSLEYDGAIGGNKFYVNGVGGVPRLVIESSGDVGIGTIQPAERLEVLNSGDVRIRVTSTDNTTAAIDLVRSSTGNTDWRIENGGNLKLFASSNIDNSATEYYSFSTNIFRPSVDNVISLGASSNRWTAVYAVNGTIQTSDERYKQNIVSLEYGLDEINSIRPISYQWREGSDRSLHLGFIAQQVQNIVPEVVNSENPEYLGMNYSELVPVLVKAVQELSEKVNTQEMELRRLREEVHAK